MYSELDGCISVDSAPHGSFCEGKGCRRHAEQRLTVIGGGYHNVNGLYCYSCGEEFARMIKNIVGILALEAKKHSLCPLTR